MRPLYLDFERGSPPVSAWGVALLAAGLIAAAAVLMQFIETRDELASADLQAQSLRRKVQSAADARVSPQELAAAQQVLRNAGRLSQQLNLPWDQLLLDLEAATDSSVALLSFEPDAQKRQLRLVGEAKTLADALAFVTRLEGSVLLSEPQLVSHETRQSDGVKVIGFTLYARWDDPS